MPAYFILVEKNINTYFLSYGFETLGELAGVKVTIIVISSVDACAKKYALLGLDLLTGSCYIGSMSDINLKQAGQFLQLLDSTTDKFTFQTFDDLKARKSNKLAETFYGSLAELAPKLIELNLAGAGIYVTINRVLPSERRVADNITHIRAFFSDKDDSVNITKPSLAPSMIVNSANGIHSYYLIDEPIELKGYNQTLFHDMQKRMAKYFNSDESVCDLPRVMRMPGFYHMKDPENPVMVTFDSIEAQKYSLDDLNSMLPVIADSKPIVKSVSVSNIPPDARGVITDKAEQFLSEPWENSRGNNSILVHTIANLKKNNYPAEECIELLEKKGEKLDFNTYSQLVSIYNDDERYPINPYMVLKKKSWSDVLESSRLFIDIANSKNSFGVNEALMLSRRYDLNSVRQMIGGDKTRKLSTFCEFNYKPDKNAYLFETDNDLPVFNTYVPPFWKKENFFRGTAIPRVDQLPEPYLVFLKHLLDNDEGSIEYVLDWMANSVQGKRNIPILALVGTVRGLGKNIFGSINRELHGHTNFELTKQQLISKEFNSQLANKTFIQLDETKITNEKEFETIKSFTNDIISIEGKGVDTITANFTASILLTNNITESLSGVSDKDDRQFSIPMVGKIPMLKRKEYREAWERKRLFKDLTLVGDFARYLYYRKVPDTVINNYKSEHYYDIIKQSLKDWERFILEDIHFRYSGSGILFQSLRDAVRANEGGRVNPGRSSFEKLCKDYPHKVYMARVKGERVIIFSRENEMIEEFQNRVEELRKDNFKNLKVIDRIDRRGSDHG